MQSPAITYNAYMSGSAWKPIPGSSALGSAGSAEGLVYTAKATSWIGVRTPETEGGGSFWERESVVAQIRCSCSHRLLLMTATLQTLRLCPSPAPPHARHLSVVFAVRGVGEPNGTFCPFSGGSHAVSLLSGTPKRKCFTRNPIE